MEFTEKLTIAPCAASDWRNTMRLIDADALKKELEVWVVAINQPQFYNREEALYIIDSAPTADVAPVVRGEWIAEQKTAEYCEFRCSACDGSIGQTDQFDETEAKQFSEWYKYCPCCGARMDGGS